VLARVLVSIGSAPGTEAYFIQDFALTFSVFMSIRSGSSTGVRR
jgi:hypothetical protein